MSDHPLTPYSQMSDAYGKKSAAAAVDQRELEGRALMKAAQKLEHIAKQFEGGGSPDLEAMNEALDYNRKLWTVFASETGNDEHPLPDQIKNNIANLAIFVFKRTVHIQTDPSPEKFSVLIDINRQIASGLFKKPQEEADKESGGKEKEPESPPSGGHDFNL